MGTTPGNPPTYDVTDFQILQTRKIVFWNHGARLRP